MIDLVLVVALFAQAIFIALVLYNFMNIVERHKKILKILGIIEAKCDLIKSIVSARALVTIGKVGNTEVKAYESAGGTKNSDEGEG